MTVHGRNHRHPGWRVSNVALIAVAVASTGFAAHMAVNPTETSRPQSHPTPAPATTPPADTPHPRQHDNTLTKQLNKQRNRAERQAMDIPIKIVTPVPNPETPDPTVAANLTGNRTLGYQLLLEFGFAANQWPALDKLWTRESQWNQYADNPTSSAYGIPQALPGSKMAAAGPDWETNPTTQIKWGLSYIRARYGTPTAALAHSDRNGWY